MLDDEIPKWNKSKETISKVRRASKSFDGEDFLDSEGNILENFRSEFTRMVKGKK